MHLSFLILCAKLYEKKRKERFRQRCFRCKGLRMMTKQDNYALARDRAAAYFLGFSQEELICRWDLSYDAQWLYVVFLHRAYRICRKTGQVYRSEDGSAADFTEALSIYDLLCHEGYPKVAAGRYAPVNSLGTRYVGVTTDFSSADADFFDRNFFGFTCSCHYLGGEPVPMGDAGFCFTIFRDLKVQLKLYRSDEEFPASLTLLWDTNTLEFMKYETVFYVAGVLQSLIRQQMGL